MTPMQKRSRFSVLALAAGLAGCASGGSFVPAGANVNHYSYVVLDIDLPGSEAPRAERELNRLFGLAGLRPVSADDVARFDESSLGATLVCDLSRDTQGSDMILMRCRDLAGGEVYRGAGRGRGIEKSVDKAFEGFDRDFVAYVPQSPAGIGKPTRNAPRAPPSAPLWGRSVRPTELIRLTERDLLPSTKPSVLARATESVVFVTTSTGTGSAVVITRDGLALTNHHVAGMGGLMTARPFGQRELPARLLRSDSAADVALIQIQCDTTCITASLGGDVDVGTDVFAIGAPLTLEQTVTRGIVSAIRLAGSTTIVQTDASVNHGNSGGPLINAATGDVVAIVQSKIVDNEVEGIGFAVAINDALRILGIRKPQK